MNKSQMTVKKATIINGCAKYYNVVCTFVVNMILARILTPEEYGVVAVVTVFTTFFTIFSDMGLGVAYIQNRELTDDDRNNIFSFMVYAGGILFLLLFAFSYFIAWFYKSNVYIPVAKLLGINLLFTAVNVIPFSHLQKEQRFITSGAIQILSCTVAAVCAIFFAKNGFSYYSIVFQSIISIGIQMICNMVLVRPTFRIKPKLSSLIKVKEFTIGQLSFNIINYFSRNLDNLLIGKCFGNESLGYYDKAYKLTTYPVSNFSSIIGSSIQPVLYKKQDDVECVYKEFKKAFLFLLVIGTYAAVFLYFSARETILLVYGPQWEKSIKAFSFLALSLYAQMTLNISGGFYQVLNNTKLMAKMSIVSALFIVGGISVGLSFKNIEAVAIGYLFGQSLNFIVTLLVLENKLFKIRFSDIYSNIIKIIIDGCITYGVCSFVFSKYIIDNLLISFLVKLGISLTIYIVFAYIFRFENLVWSVVRKGE